ncbi:MAG: zinc ribbon domain-containing protein [Chloroflexi bacterium]|nr:zinc ribbon domain-containing protein [Chloroflexota bacterium]MCL5107561.1 zinc ribbon domain-containing protein [Chloroflexota bacterium]
MTTLIIAAMAILAIVVVGLPLYRAGVADLGDEPAPDETGVEGQSLVELVAQRDATYRAIKEIEFDFQVGNLSETDFADLRQRYKAKALGLIRAIREFKDAQAPAAELPAAVVAAAPLRPAETGTDDRIERAVAGRRHHQTVGITCPACGQTCSGEARFCSHCGRPLALFCPQCGRPCGGDENFCGKCGTPLRSTSDVAATIG